MRLGAVRCGLLAGAAVLAVPPVLAQGGDPRLNAKDVCDYVAGLETTGPSDAGDRENMFVEDGLVFRGVLDLDGDGVSEKVSPAPGGTMGGDGYDIVKADGSSTYAGLNMSVEDEALPDGFGSAFLHFDRRWYLVTFAREEGAFPTGVVMFDKGVVPKTACKFDNTAVEDMHLANMGANADARWCNNRAAADAKAHRMKPTSMLSEGQAAALGQAMMAAVNDTSTSYGGRELYAPTTGPFAGLTLWKAELSSGAGRGCAGRLFRIVEDDGQGGYRLSASPTQTLLNRMQSDTDRVEPFNCSSDVNLFEANGRFFLDRTSGDEAPVNDAMLFHSIMEAQGGQSMQVCAAGFRITSTVSYRSPELTK